MGNIQAPAGQDVQDGYRTYSPEQQKQIWSAIPESSRNFMMLPYRNNPDPIEKEQLAKKDAAWIIGIFYKDVYATSKTAITPAIIDDWMKSESLDGQPEYHKMLSSYFIDGMPPPSASVSDNSQNAPEARSTSENVPIPASAVSPTTSTPAPTQQTLDVSAPSTITINVRTSK